MSKSVKELAFGDIERELTVTRRVLEQLPESEFAWKVHEKSMSLAHLAMHVAQLPGWMVATLDADELDFATMPPPPPVPTTVAAVLAAFDEHAAKVRASLAKLSDADLERPWSVRNGATVLHTDTKATILRVWCVSHLVHHRAQLCVYLRMKNVPVPAVYFNSADEPEWRFE